MCVCVCVCTQYFCHADCACVTRVPPHFHYSLPSVAYIYYTCRCSWHLLEQQIRKKSRRWVGNSQDCEIDQHLVGSILDDQQRTKRPAAQWHGPRSRPIAQITNPPRRWANGTRAENCGSRPIVGIRIFGLIKIIHKAVSHSRLSIRGTSVLSTLLLPYSFAFACAFTRSSLSH